MLLWKILADVIPTKDRIKHFVPLEDLSYYLCGNMPETISHIIFDYPAAIACWLNSP